MNRLIKKQISLLIIIAIILGACVKKNFDYPPAKDYNIDFESNISISDLKALYPQGGEIDTNLIIKGTVISDDSHGNFYQAIVIQDSTGGIQLNASLYDIYNKYPVGQLVYVKCEGLHIRDNGGIIELNFISNQEIVDMPETTVSDYVYKANGGIPIVPKVIKISELNNSHINTLVKFENVEFVPGDTSLTYGAEDDYYTSRTITDFAENTIAISTSKYTDFIDVEIPNGNGSVVAILNEYSGQKQLYLRNTDEVVMNDDRIIRNYLFEEDFVSSLGSFTTYDVLGNTNWYHTTFDQQTFAKISGYNNGENEDWLISPAIDLSTAQNAVLTFTHAVGYLTTWDDMTVWVSTNYDGISNPNDQGTWIKLTGYNEPIPSGSNNWSPFESSGIIDISEYTGASNFYLAFKYICTASAASTWEVASVKIITQ